MRIHFETVESIGVAILFYFPQLRFASYHIVHKLHNTYMNEAPFLCAVPLDDFRPIGLSLEPLAKVEQADTHHYKAGFSQELGPVERPLEPIEMETRRFEMDRPGGEAVSTVFQDELPDLSQ